MKEYGVEWGNTKAYEMTQGESSYNLELPFTEVTGF